MSLVSIEFLLSAIIVALIYFLLPAKIQWAWLLLASSFFYYKNSAWYQGLNLLVFLSLNFIISLAISNATNKRKPIYVGILSFDVLYLLIFKYFSFFVPLFLKVGLSEQIVGTVKVYAGELCPMGISYIALIVIGYLTDLYWENVSVQRNPGKFLLFSCYFPQVVSGPLVKYKEQDGNLWGVKHEFSYNRTVRGLERVLFGVFKKLVISSRAGIIANNIVADIETYNGLYIPIAVMFYIIQLYSDFSGLMDIVIGLSEVFGINMPENFNTPFYSESISEFWRRWHITLGRFLKDYVLFPMQMSKGFRKFRKFYKNKVGKDFEKKVNIPRYMTMLISWIIIGFWHGGGWNYIFGVGIYMWAVIILGELLSPLFEKMVTVLKINTECFSWHLFRRIRTFLLYMFGVSFFFANTMQEGIAMWKSAFSCFNPWILVDKSLYSLGLEREEMNILIFSVLILFIVSHFNQEESFRDKINRQNFIFRVLVFLCLFVLTVTWGHYGFGYDAASFIYGRF